MTATDGAIRAMPRDLRLEGIVRHLVAMPDQKRASTLLGFHPEAEGLERQRSSAAPGRTLNDLLWEELAVREELAIGKATVTHVQANDPLASAEFMHRRRSLRALERFVEVSRSMSREVCLLGVLSPQDAEQVVALAGLWATTAAVSGVNERQRETLLGAIHAASARNVVDCGLQSDDWKAAKPLGDFVRPMLGTIAPGADVGSAVGARLIGVRLGAWNRATVQEWLQLAPSRLSERNAIRWIAAEGAASPVPQDVDALLARVLRHLGHWAGA